MNVVRGERRTLYSRSEREESPSFELTVTMFPERKNLRETSYLNELS